MRSFSVLATAALAFFSTVLAQDSIPACAKLCLTPGTIPFGDCKSASDGECLCKSKAYVQGGLDCITSSCTDQKDITTAIQVANSICLAFQVNTPPAGVTTAAPGEPKTKAATATTSTAASAAATSKSAASAPIGVNQPLVLLGAAAVAFGVAL